MEETSHAVDGNSFITSLAKLRREIETLFSDTNYMLLFFAFSVGIGIFNTVLTLLNQLVMPFGYRYTALAKLIVSISSTDF